MKTRALVLLFFVCLGIPYAAGRTIFTVTTDNKLFQFDSSSPTVISSPVLITGLASGDQIHGIDFRPANGVLYALATNPSTSPDIGRIYTINTATAVATQIGTNFST